MRTTGLALTFLLTLLGCGAGGTSEVRLVRVPDDGIQPRVEVKEGTLHLLYYRGERSGGDLFYTRSTDSARSFAEGVQVNSQDGSAISGGTIRGGELAVGKDGRVHVAWNGSGIAKPKGLLNPEQPEDSPHNGLPFLYSHSAEGGGFTPQRNLINQTFALDGGGTIGADEEGDVYAAWHGSSLDSGPGEAGRQVWLTRSKDGGESFSEETAVSDPAEGACGCCSMHLFVGRDGRLAAFYRTARELENRDSFLLTSTDYGKTFQGSLLQPWKIAACPMSSASFSDGPAGLFVSWETEGQVWFAPIDISSGKMTAEPTAAPGEGSNRKHPSLAQNQRGEVLLAWTEVGGWGEAGSVYWQIYDAAGAEVGEIGAADGLPAWSFATAAALADGEFLILY